MAKITDNALDLLKQRYFQEGENSWEDLCKRVSHNIASAEITKELQEKYEKEFYDAMVNMDFIPSTPCFTEGNKVTMSDGTVKNIEGVKLGDIVLTHTGEKRKVTDFFVRETIEPIFNINITKLIKNEFKCTGSHPILSIKKDKVRFPSGHIKRNLNKLKVEPEWINAKDLNIGDYVVIGKYNTKIVDKTELIVSEILQDRYEIKLEDNIIYRVRDYVIPNGDVGKTKRGNGIPNIIPINEYFLTLVGYFLAEGYVDIERNRIRLTFNKNETEYINYVSKVVKLLFNIDVCLEYNGNTCIVVIHSNILTCLFHELFGSYGDTIKLPEWVMELPYEKQKYIIKGLFKGDGCHYVPGEHTSKDTPDRIKMTLNNRNLISQIFYIFLRLGHYCSMTSHFDKKYNKKYYTIEIAPSYSKELCDLIDKNTYKKRKKQCFYRIINGYLLFPILDISFSIENTKVYNLEVEEDHSYIVNGVCVHNCLLNAGTKTQQLSSCFILNIEDSIEGIMNTLSECAKIFQKSGGAGFNISTLRPAGSPLANSGGFASGCISFMRIFNALVEEVKHGNSRKGAIKIDLDVSHPDIYEFIHCKDDLTQLQNMNISVSITDAFMNAVLNDKKWDLKFNNKVYKTVKAKELWNEIIESAWKTGEPGLSFRDIMNNGNMNPHLGEIKGSNPCAEFINIAYSSCNLGSINLANIIENKQVNYENLEYIIRLSIRFLDNMISVNKLPIPKIQQVTEDIRPIGLGTMGLADMLFKLEIPMSSQKGIEFIDNLYSYIQSIAFNESMEIALEKGVYPKWKGSIWEKEGMEIRNSNLLSIAPNGSIGFIANVNGGIEPAFALVYTRRTQEGKEYTVINSVFEEALKEKGLHSPELIEKIKENNGSCQGIKEIPKKIQEIFVTAIDMTPMEHLNCLNVVSKHVDLSCSKTINLPSTATKDEIASIYIETWKTGNIKGITVYRDNSRENQTLSTAKKEALQNHDIIFNSILPLEKEEIGETYGTNVKEKVACGNLYLSLFRDNKGNISEIFINTSKGGICQSNTNAISRLISLALRSGIKVEAICDQLIGIKCPACSILRSQGKDVNMSCPDTIGQYVLEKYNQGSTIITEKVQRKKKQTKNEKMKCPNCGEQMRLEAGCVICSCGFSKCG